MLPRLVEFILSLRRPGGGFYAQQSSMQIIVDPFPPNYTLVFDLGPSEDTFAHILYLSGRSPEMVPGAFHKVLMQAGVPLFDAIITEEHILRPTASFWVVTEALKVVTRSTNLTALNQYFEINIRYLKVFSADDLKAISEEMNRLKYPIEMPSLPGPIREYQ